MTDRTQTTSPAPEVGGYTVDDPEPTVAPSNTAKAPTEDKARSTSTSPPPAVPAATKPSALAGQSTTSSSPSSSPSPAPESRPENTVTNERRDPQVASLKAIFPDYDDAILQSILESVNGDQDRAVDLLLGMSDPNFRSDAPPPAQQEQPRMTQEQLDEELARRLMLEEQEQAQQWQQQQPYRPHRRSSRTHGQQPQQSPQQVTTPPAGGKDTMAELQEQFNKYAEIGKKNFGFIVNKVKAKIQEFDKPESGSSGSGTQPSWSGTGSASSYYDPNAASQSPPQTNYQPYHGHHLAQSAPTNTAISQPAAFYDPNPSPQPVSPPEQFASPNVSEKKPTQSSIATDGYEVEPVPLSITATSSSAAASQPAQSATAATNSNYTATAPPRGPSPANPIDGGKLGLLPKRPISLIRDPPQNQPPAQRRNTDDDELEYAESPFDNDRK